MNARTIANCRFHQSRANVDSVGGNYCALVQQVSGVHDIGLCAVDDAICHECCKWFEPSQAELNPITASLLYRLTSEVMRGGGTSGCSAGRAGELQKLAIHNLPSQEEFFNSFEIESTSKPHSIGRLEQFIPIAHRRSGPLVRRLSIGVTTAPRAASTLDECLDSLKAAGFPPPRLFIDGEVTISDRHHGLERTRRTPQLGAWPSYYLALGEMLMREPIADAYLIVQDDALFGDFPDMKQYLEQALWPGQPGIATLFCSSAYTRPNAGWYKMDSVWVWSAQALLFSRQAAESFLADRDVVLHRRSTDGKASIDSLIGRWAYRNGCPIYYPVPSLVQHIGSVSSIWPGTRTFGCRRANWFVGQPNREPGKGTTDGH